MPKNKTTAQMIWGVALILAGMGVFYRIPQVIPKIENIEQFSSAIFFIRFCFYFMGHSTYRGGSKKIYNYYHKLEGKD